MNEPAMDLGIVMALLSSYRDKPIDEKTIVFGEVGLSGEVRAVSQAAQRVQEAKKLGFHTVIMPAVSIRSMGKTDGIEIVGVRTLKDVAAESVRICIEHLVYACQRSTLKEALQRLEKALHN